MIYCAAVSSECDDLRNVKESEGSVHMVSTEELKNKEVINICDGQSLGYVCDIEVDLECGTVIGMILPCKKNLLKVFGSRNDDYLVKWDQVHTIGCDVILVEIHRI